MRLTLLCQLVRQQMLARALAQVEAEIEAWMDEEDEATAPKPTPASTEAKAGVVADGTQPRARRRPSKALTEWESKVAAEKHAAEKAASAERLAEGRAAASAAKGFLSGWSSPSEATWVIPYSQTAELAGLRTA